MMEKLPENPLQKSVKQEQVDIKTEDTAAPVAVEVPEHEKCPDGGYGWVCVLAVFIINCFTWGVLSSYGVFLAYYLANNVFPGMTALDPALIGGLNFGVAMLAATPVTILVRRYGTHAPMVVGVILQAGGFVAASFARQVWQLYLTQGILVGMGVGLQFVPSVAIISQWFDKKRSVATGITSGGAGVGGVIFSFVTQAIIKNISLGWALRITGIVSGVMNLVATALIRDRRADIKPTIRGFDWRLLKRLDVLLLFGWGFPSMLGYMTLLYSLPDFSSAIGLTSSQAAATAAFLNLGTAVGRPCVGLLSDRFGRIEVAGIMTFLNTVAVFAIWLPARSYGVTIFYAIVDGAILGVFWMTISPLCVEVAGLKELPSMLALSWWVVALPVTFAEAIALKLRRPASSRPYLYPQIFAGLSYLVASMSLFALWWIQRPKRKSKDALAMVANR